MDLADHQKCWILSHSVHLVQFVSLLSAKLCGLVGRAKGSKSASRSRLRVPTENYFETNSKFEINPALFMVSEIHTEKTAALTIKKHTIDQFWFHRLITLITLNDGKKWRQITTNTGKNHWAKSLPVWLTNRTNTQSFLPRSPVWNEHCILF